MRPPNRAGQIVGEVWKERSDQVEMNDVAAGANAAAGGGVCQ